MSIVILPADKGRSAVILNREDYLEKCMDHINNVPHQLLKKDPTSKIKAKTLKQLKALKNNEFIDKKLHWSTKKTFLVQAYKHHLYTNWMVLNPKIKSIFILKIKFLLYRKCLILSKIADFYII